VSGLSLSKNSKTSFAELEVIPECIEPERREDGGGGREDGEQRRGGGKEGIKSGFPSIGGGLNVREAQQRLSAGSEAKPACVLRYAEGVGGRIGSREGGRGGGKGGYYWWGSRHFMLGRAFNTAAGLDGSE